MENCDIAKDETKGRDAEEDDQVSGRERRDKEDSIQHTILFFDSPL